MYIINITSVTDGISMDKHNLFIVLWNPNPPASVQIHMIPLSAGFKFGSYREVKDVQHLKYTKNPQATKHISWLLQLICRDKAHLCFCIINVISHLLLIFQTIQRINTQMGATEDSGTCSSVWHTAMCFLHALQENQRRKFFWGSSAGKSPDVYLHTHSARKINCQQQHLHSSVTARTLDSSTQALQNKQPIMYTVMQIPISHFSR